MIKIYTMFTKATVLIFSLILFLQSCNSIEPPDNAAINLSLEDAASIEAWLKLSTTNLQLPTTVTIKQSAAGGDQIRGTIIWAKSDSILYIDSLLPNQTYKFQAITQSSNQSRVTSLQ
ncbi:MAG: hypothetical protein P8X73_00345 [Ignavibacteriaceae bacterium]